MVLYILKEYIFREDLFSLFLKNSNVNWKWSVIFIRCNRFEFRRLYVVQWHLRMQLFWLIKFDEQINILPLFQTKCTKKNKNFKFFTEDSVWWMINIYKYMSCYKNKLTVWKAINSIATCIYVQFRYHNFTNQKVNNKPNLFILGVLSH